MKVQNLLLVIVVILFLAIIGVRHPGINPVANSYADNSNNSDSLQLAPTIQFTNVKSLTELMGAIKKSVGANKPVMIEFYATWCPACRAVQANILPDPAVRRAAQNVTAIGVDCSEPSPIIKEMMDAFHVYAFPTFIYYNKDGTPNAAGNIGAGTSKELMVNVLQQMSH